MGRFYVKRSGKLYGPFSREQVANCVSLELFSLQDDISDDQIRWEKIEAFSKEEPLKIPESPKPEYSSQSPDSSVGEMPPAKQLSVNASNPYTSFWTRYADFHGRSSRTEYWVPILIHTLVIGILYGAFLTTYNGIFLLLLLIPGVVLFIPSLAVGGRRLHDCNLSGFLLLLQIIPFGGVVLLILFCLPGTAGPNPYGPPGESK